MNHRQTLASPHRPPPLHNPGKNMRTICFFNESADESITRPILEAIAAAIYRQVSEHYAQFWEASPPDAIVVAMSKEQIPSGAAVVHILDKSDEPGALGYHYVTDTGQPVTRVFWNPILVNGGTLFKGANSLSVTLSHEVLEMLGDPYCNWWADCGTGDEEDSLELCDRVEGDAYEIDRIWVSNFLGPRAFRDGDGPYDWMRLLTKPYEVRHEGYAIRRTGGPAGETKEIYGEMHPAWKRDLKNAKKMSRSRKRGSLPEVVVQPEPEVQTAIDFSDFELLSEVTLPELHQTHDFQVAVPALEETVERTPES